MTIELTNFAERHFNNKGSGTKIEQKYKNDILNDVNISLKKINSLNIKVSKDIENIKLLDGYADFCKLLIIPNNTNTSTGTSKITNENYQWLRTGYYSRTEKELPVLTRALHLPLKAEKAKYLVFVLYSRKQLEKEYNDKKSDLVIEYLIDHPTLKASELNIDDLLYKNKLVRDLDENSNAEWGIVSIMAQMTNEEEPMTPATIIRNHIGTTFGGSGVDIDKKYYQKSVEFWEKHALVK